MQPKGIPLAPRPSWLLAALAALTLALPGAALAADGSTTLTVTGKTEREVANDHMTVLMTTEARAPEAATAAATVNRNMEAALERAAEHDAIDARTIGYSTHAIHDSDDRSRINAWQVRQNLELTSGDFDRLGELVGSLQQHDLTVSQIRFSLSPEARKEHREAMMEEAMEDLKEQARVIARSLGATHLRVLEVELPEDPYSGPQPMMAMRAMDESASQPALEAGHSTLSLSVRGRLQALGAETLRVGPR
ncbi:MULTISPECIES: SIMPL domain-containing protein [unclassified Thioalkalivibrio]|uniref:SIMPL domain-containing protein n=1 Tax=unclassified Thioalkalivibrio TaxID=2621013 RepID=UPI00037F359F|nr:MULTISPECIES: SIMPL domain-containing protein [unclassified Thioalkalivibrio]